MPTFPYATIGDIPFTGELQANGLRWVLEDIDGWDAPDVEIKSIPRAESDGSFITGGRFTHRELILKGTAWGNSIEHAWRAREFLTKNLAGAVRGERELQWHDSTGSKVMYCRLNGRIRTEKAGPYGITFEVPLMAPDPRKYSLVENSFTFNLASGAQETTQNVPVGGTYNSFWIATITGDIALPRLKNITQAGEPYVAVDLTVSPAYALEIDSKARTIVQATANRYDALNLSLSKWWPMAGGRTNTIRFSRQTAGAGAATCVLRWRDAWI